MQAKSNEDLARQWTRLVNLISQFETEHHVYHKFVFDGYNLKRYASLKQQHHKTGSTDKKIPVIGKASKRPQSPGCISREAGFDNGSQTEDESKSPKFRSSKEEKDDASQRSWSPTKLPKYRDPEYVRYLSAVKNDLNVFKNSLTMRVGKAGAKSFPPSNSFVGDSVELASLEAPSE